MHTCNSAAVQRSDSNKQQLKSIFSCNRTHECSTTPKRNHFKSTSAGNWNNDPQVLYFNEKIIKKTNKPKVVHHHVDIVKEMSTQTSKTILQLAKMEAGCMSPDSLTTTTPRDCSMDNCPYSISHRISDFTLDGSCHEQDCIFNTKRDKFIVPTKYKNNTLTKTFLEKNRNKTPVPINNPQESIKSKSFVEPYHHPNYILEAPPPPPPAQVKVLRPPRRSSRSMDLPDHSYARTSFMCPTASSQIKSKMDEIRSVNHLIPAMRRGRSTSPRVSVDRRRFESSKRIPYIDQSKSDVSSATTIVNTARNPEKLLMPNTINDGFEEDLVKIEDLTIDNCKEKTTSDEGFSLVTNIDSSVDNAICQAVNKLRESDWRVALRGLAELVELCRIVDVDLIFDYMPNINQRLIELLKSPRSHVCRTACQAAGHFFEYIKDTRRPEFDDIVDLLLHKTADANKFIRQDANLALDCMVTHIPTFHAVRAVCSKGPFHKNHLVRCATVRLLVCAVVIAGPDFILNPCNNEYTRKRIILNMNKFLEDKNLDTRKFGERLYKILCKEAKFDAYLKKYLEKEQIVKIKKTLKLVHKK